MVSTVLLCGEFNVDVLCGRDPSLCGRVLPRYALRKGWRYCGTRPGWTTVAWPWWMPIMRCLAEGPMLTRSVERSLVLCRIARFIFVPFAGRSNLMHSARCPFRYAMWKGRKYCALWEGTMATAGGRSVLECSVGRCIMMRSVDGSLLFCCAARFISALFARRAKGARYWER